MFIQVAENTEGGYLPGNAVNHKTWSLTVRVGLNCLCYPILGTSLLTWQLLFYLNQKEEGKETWQQDMIENVWWSLNWDWKPELKVWIYRPYNSGGVTSLMFPFLMRQKRKVGKCLGSEVRHIWTWILSLPHAVCVSSLSLSFHICEIRITILPHWIRVLQRNRMNKMCVCVCVCVCVCRKREREWEREFIRN